MMPLDMGVQQRHFLLTSVAPTCGFCLPGGAEQFVEIQAKAPVKYVLDPVVYPGGSCWCTTKAGGSCTGLRMRRGRKEVRPTAFDSTHRKGGT